MNYEVWNTATRNIVGAFATEAEALALIDQAIGAHGPGYADTLALVLDDGDEIQTLAMGSELMPRVRDSAVSAPLGAPRR